MAYTYTGTPSQRIEQAQQRISDDSVVQNTALSSYLRAAKQQTQQTVAPESNAKWYERIGDTLGDVAKSVFTGFTKAFEGLADFGASTVGMFAGWAGNDDLKQSAADWTARDLTGTEMWDAMRDSGLNVDFESSWINDLSGTAQNIIRGVGQGVGQMLPMIALTVATGGAAGAATAGAVAKGAMTAGKAAKLVSTVSKATKAANLIGLGMTAAGSSTESALNQTVFDENGNPQKVELDRAYLYGLASGAVEVATEKLVGGPFEKMTGSGLADKLINRLGKSTAFEKAVRVAAGYIGEGVEEMVSEAVSGSLQKIYDDNADTSPDVEAVFEAGVIGSLTAAVLGTGGQIVNKASNVQSVQDAMLDVENIDKRAESLRKNGKLTEEKTTRLETERKNKLEVISKRYKRATEKQQAKMRAALPQLADILNEDGSIKEVALEEGATEITTAQASGAMSGNLAISRRKQVANTLNKQGIKIAENISENEAIGAGWFAEALDRLVGRKSGIKSKYVLVDGLPVGGEQFQDGDITYIDRNNFTDTVENGKTVSKWSKIARAFAHEIDHFAEGSKEYAVLHAVLKDTGARAAAIADMRSTSVSDSTKTVADEYGIAMEVIDAIAEGKDLSGLNQSQVRLVLSEIHAKETEFLFGNKERIDRLVAEDKNVAKKILNRIKNAINEITAYVKGDTDKLEELQKLRVAEKLFSDSLAEAGQGYLRKKTAETQRSIRGNELVKKYDKLNLDQNIDEMDGVAAIRLEDGSILPFTEPHVTFIKNNNIDVDDIDSGGWINKGVYEASERSDTQKYIEQQKAKKRMDARRAEVQHSIRSIIGDDGTDYGMGVYLDSTLLEGLSDSERIAIVKERIKELGGQVFTAVDGNGQAVDITIVESTRKFYNKNGKRVPVNKDLVSKNIGNTTKQEAVVLIDELIETSRVETTKPSLYTHDWLDGEGQNDWEYWNTYIEDKAGNIWKATLNVANASTGEKVLYDVEPIKKTGRSVKSDTAPVSNTIVRENSEKSTPIAKKGVQRSIRGRDNLGRSLSSQQQEFFKDSKVVDKDGNLLVVYHGTVNEFYTFDRQYAEAEGDWGKGFYFTSTPSDVATNYSNENGADLTNKIARYAESLENQTEYEDLSYEERLKIAKKHFVKGKARTIESYLNVENPARIGENETILDYNENYDEETGEYADEEPTGLLVDFVEALQNNVDSFESWGTIDFWNILGDLDYYEGISLSKAAEKLKESVLDTLTTDDGSLAINELIRLALQDMGFDGIIDTTVSKKFRNMKGMTPDTKHIIVFESNQAKLVDNSTPTENPDIRFSKRGSIKHEELLKTLDGIQLDYLGRAYAKIDTPSKFFEGDERNARLAAQIEQMSTMDIAIQTKYADDLTDGIINNMVLTDVSPDELDALMHDANAVNHYRKKLNIKSILPEIESKYGKEAARGIALQWQAPNGKTGLGVDTIVEELRGDGIIIHSTNEADIFFEMMDALDKTKDKTEKILNKRISEVLSEEEQTALHDEIRDSILDFMQEHGAEADWAANYKKSQRQMKKMLDDAQARATAIIDQATLQAQQIEERAAQEGRDYKKLLALEQQQFEAGMHDDLEFYKAQKDAEVRDAITEAQSEAADSVSYMVQVQHATDDAYSAAVSLSKMERKKYHNASKVWNEPWEALVSQLSRVKYRGVLRKYGSRKIITEFGEKWYNIDNEVLNGGLTHDEALAAHNDPNATHVGYLDKHVLRAIDYLRENLERPLKAGKNKGQMTENNYDLSYYELRAVECVLNGAKHIMETYDRVNISLTESVTLSETAKNDTGMADAISGHVRSKFRALRSTESLIRQIIAPDAILAEMFGHNAKATLPKLYRFLLDGTTEGQRAQIEMDNIIEDFLREHKSYKKHFDNDTITIAGHELPVSVAIDLMMTSRDAQSWDSLINAGWGYYDKNHDWQQIGKFTIEDIESMTKGLEQRDIECLEMLRKFYDTTTQYTIEGQKRTDGTSILERETNTRYYPRSIYSGDVANIVDDKPTLMSILTPGFLKERVKHKHRLAGRNAFERARMHSKAVGQYYGTALPMKELQRLYNSNVGGENNPTRSIRTIINEQSWNGFESWWTNLLEDIQGTHKAKTDTGSKIIESVRGNVIKAILSVNIKSMMSQLAGYPAAFAYLDAWSMAKAFGNINLKESFNSMMKHCNWAFVKHYSGGAVLAQTLTDKFNKATDIGTIGIQGMDTLLNVLIWNACQQQVAENHKGDATFQVGSEENMKEAAVLHTTVGIKTQGNSAKGEQSAMQRSTNPLIKTLAAFNSDGFKMISRLYEGIDRLLALRYLEQHGQKVDVKAKSDAKKFAAKASAALIVSNLVYTLIAELFNHMLNKDRDEDDEGNEKAWATAFGKSFLANLVGNVPVLRDVYDYFADGYDVKDYSLGAFNDILKAMGDGFGIIKTLSDGESYDSKDIAAPLKSLVISMSQLAGLPARNVYNYLYGFTKRFDEGAAYEWNSMFYTSNYAADLTKAVESGDTDLQTTIVGLMLKDDGMTDTSAKVNDKLRELYAEGLTVLPRSVNDTFSFDGEVYTMTQRQRKAFKAVYAQANDEVETLINKKGLNTLPKEVQAKAIRWIYDYYYESAVYATVGEEPDSKKQLFGETMDLSKFAMTIAACATTESELDKKGNVIAGSKKQAVLNLLNQMSLTSSERLIILAYLGYSVEDDAAKVKSYISRVGLSKAQQKQFLDYCGIAA